MLYMQEEALPQHHQFPVSTCGGFVDAQTKQKLIGMTARSQEACISVDCILA